MNDYDFSTLNDKEFENISMELISRDKKKRYERFKPGKDAGVDGRFSGFDGKEEIIQCKHYLKTGYKGLISSLKKKDTNKKTELDKVIKLNPKKYIFVTSLPLSRKEKIEMHSMFQPYIKNDSDIYGQEDLNDILRKNPKIEEHHYKLWISSTTVLKRIFNNAIKGRSEFLLEDIKEKIKLYVITDNHNKAIEKLNDSHTIIIAGEPGIGKTTLAEHIALTYIEKGFEFCVIENSLNEAEAIFESDKKQIFYFDDFLGSNYLEALKSHTSSQIMNFIKRVKKDKNKRFILTSRTNIFNQSLVLSDTFKNKKLESDEFIIKVDSLKDIDKAMILYNHMWHSELDEKYIDELYKDKRYKDIIKHKNFNPRIIEFITDIDRLESISVDSYWTYLKEKLDNPVDIWRNTFDEESDGFMRNLVVLTVLNGNKIDEKNLKISYTFLNDLIKVQNNSHSSKEFESIIEKVVKYFLTRTETYNKTIEYALFNPSIADFIIERYKDNSNKLIECFLSLHTIQSLKALRSFSYNKTITQEMYQKVLLALYRDVNILELENPDDIDYVIQLLYMVEIEPFKKDINKNKINTFYKSMILHPISFTLIDEFITTLIYLESDDIVTNNYDFIILMIENSSDELDNINKIIELIKYFAITDTTVINYLNKSINTCLEYGLDSSVSDLSVDDVTFEHDEEGNTHLENDAVPLEDLLSDLISEVNEFSGRIIENSTVLEFIELEDVKDNLISAYYDNLPDEETDERIETSYIDTIDDLFER